MNLIPSWFAWMFLIITQIIMLHFLQQLETWVKGKIYIISYRALNNELKSQYLNEKYVWMDRMSQSFVQIENTIKKLNKDDIVVVCGGERLTHILPHNSIATVKMWEKESNLHLQEDEDWKTFSRNLDSLYYKVQASVTGLIFICNVNNKIAEQINTELEASENMSIMKMEELVSGKDKRLEAENILKLMKNQSLESCLEIINENAEKLSDEQINMCKAVAFFNNGNITTSIDILSADYEKLSNEQKSFLADLYILKNNQCSAQKIFEELYTIDCQQKGVYELGLRAYPEESKRYEEILLEGIKYQADNLVIIESYANWLSFHENFKEAAKWFRRIDRPYHKLVAKVNDLLEEKQSDLKVVKAYIFDIVEEYPELKNEAILRIGLYALKDNHYFEAYNIFKEANIEQVSEVTKMILRKKIEILMDTAKASKALRKIKPYAKESDRELLILERCAVLYQSIHVFSYDAEGFYCWRELLSCQQLDTWNKGIKKYVISILKKLNSMDISSKVKVSYIHNLKINEEDLNGDNAIFCLRKSNCGEMTFEKFGCTREEIVKGTYAIGEKAGTTTQKIWIRYYCSIGASVLNENPQDANSFSLALPETIVANDTYNKELCAALYLMSWGNAQFRLGNHIEGMACVNVAMEKLIFINEITPVLEEGGNILTKYLVAYEDSFSEEEKKIICECVGKLSTYNQSLQPVWNKFSNSLSDLISEYKRRVENNEKDANWLIDLANLIQFLVQNEDYEAAMNYIKKNYIEAKKLLDQRRDIAAQVLHSWGKIIIMCEASEENVLWALDLMNEAIQQIQSRRNVYHQEERAALAEEYDMILRDYLGFAGAYYGASNLKHDIKDLLKKKILQKMAICLPLSIIEQKYYFKYKFVSEELETKSVELKTLKKEYGIMLKENKADTEEVNAVAKKIEALTKELVAKHPYYKSLDQYEGTDWQEIQRVLENDEVVYQYILTDLTVLSILVTRNWIDIRTKIVDASFDSPINAMKKYGNIVENSQLSSKEVDMYSDMISELVAQHLCEYVYNYDIKSVYVIPDVSKSIFPIAATRYKNEYLIDKVKEIVNFIDYKQLLIYIRKPRVMSKIVNRLFGKPSDKSINKIKKWLTSRETENFNNILEMNDELDSLQKLNDEEVDSIAIYGHGVKDPASEKAEGAQSIEGFNGMIQMRDILDNMSAENLVLISCVGGTPNNINPEVSSGTWASVFERFNGNIVSCKWSVQTDDTIEIINQMYDYILNDNMNISEALLLSQCYMKNKGKGDLSWAGIEYWIN